MNKHNNLLETTASAAVTGCVRLSGYPSEHSTKLSRQKNRVERLKQNVSRLNIEAEGAAYYA